MISENRVPATRTIGGLSFFEFVTKGSHSIPRRSPRAHRAFLRTFKNVASNSLLMEQVSRLRDSVIFSRLKDRPNSGGLTVALTSPRGGEGTSLVRLLLGLALGECQTRRVAVLDGRFDPQRFGLLARALNLSQNSFSIQNGSSVIRGYCNERYPNIYFLSESKPVSYASFVPEMSLAAFFEKLRERFDYIIIDMPPLIRDTASWFLLPHADRLYLVVEPGRTRTADIKKSFEIVKDVGSKVSGVVLSKQKIPLWARFIWREFFY